MIHTVESTTGPTTSESVISSDGNANNNGDGFGSAVSVPSNSSNSNNNNNGDPSGQTIEDKDGQHHPVPEFLCQLTKMLTDDDNEHIIEWYVMIWRVNLSTRVPCGMVLIVCIYEFQTMLII